MSLSSILGLVHSIVAAAAVLYSFGHTAAAAELTVCRATYTMLLEKRYYKVWATFVFVFFSHCLITQTYISSTTRGGEYKFLSIKIYGRQIFLTFSSCNSSAHCVQWFSSPLLQATIKKLLM